MFCNEFLSPFLVVSGDFFPSNTMPSGVPVESLVARKTHNQLSKSPVYQIWKSLDNLNTKKNLVG